MKSVFMMSCMSFVLFNACATIYKKGESFEVPLKNEGVGGYQWKIVKSEGVKLNDSSEIEELNPNKLMQYTKVYKFEGVKKGKYKLEFHKIRSFEPEKILSKEQIYIMKIRINNE